jgi:hypothetical protein
MRLSTRSPVGIAAAFFAVFAAVAVARAETCTLELKRLDQQNPSNGNYMYRSFSPQRFFVQMMKDRAPIENQEQTAAFKRIVKKEPKYESKNPFRGVAKLGSQEFAFVLDVIPPASTDAKPDADKAKKKDVKATTDSATAKLADQILKAVAPDKAPATGLAIFNRLYFDFNRNGDLTDDRVIDADPRQKPQIYVSSNQSQASFHFPRVDVAIDDEGTKLDYSFFLEGQVFKSPDFSYTQLSLSAAAYREGHITLDGKEHHVVLIDFNSNGRFGDQIKINPRMHGPDGRIYPEQGDMLLVDPNPSSNESPYDVTGSTSRNYVSKLVNIDGKYYDVKISPAGDKLTLEPSSIPLGKVANPNGAFRAVIYGDQGVLKVRGDKDSPAAVPEGQWKLLSYTLDRTDAEKPKKPEAKKGEEKKADGKKGSMLESLAKDIESLLGDSSGSPAMAAARDRHSSVTAQATDAYKAINVSKGETAVLPFGPPYKPTVTAEYFEDGAKHKVLSLAMTLVGSTGEICTDMTVNGGRPSTPAFTITDAKGKVVEQGSFEYG